MIIKPKKLKKYSECHHAIKSVHVNVKKNALVGQSTSLRREETHHGGLEDEVIQSGNKSRQNEVRQNTPSRQK